MRPLAELNLTLGLLDQHRMLSVMIQHELTIDIEFGSVVAFYSEFVSHLKEERMNKIERQE